LKFVQQNLAHFCTLCAKILRYGDGAGNTVENSTVFPLIRMR